MKRINVIWNEKSQKKAKKRLEKYGEKRMKLRKGKKADELRTVL